MCYKVNEANHEKNFFVAFSFPRKKSDTFIDCQISKINSSCIKVLSVTMYSNVKAFMNCKSIFTGFLCKSEIV